ncbi:hypothetical protein VSDG_03179 [Cytospora chrysosperma]|uniref:Zn(2)-C6 fungal-type domain-containing protein n=1 Tax=Cytospora chrysosperma TaxID=252740 RepID=A0A423WBH3_CYTCH|nr:hypothetical protein VSDG_03179 [Valsa sordida]
MASGASSFLETTTSPTRTRSFGGCATCRGRHVKCDEGRPFCASCVRSGILCKGYENSIVFDSADGLATTAPGSVQYRRPILTELERKRMSEQLTASVPPKLALEFLSQLDEECESSAGCVDLQINRGPFAAFRVHMEGCDDAVPIVPDGPSGLSLLSDGAGGDSIVEGMMRFDDGDLLSPGFGCLSQEAEDTTCQLDKPARLPATTAVQHLESGTLVSDRIQEVCDGDMSIPGIEDFDLSPYPTTRGYTYGPSPAASYYVGAVASDPSISSNMSISNTIPPDAVFLLRHYSTTLISLLTSLRHSKTPWHILFLPFVKHTLVSLTLGEIPGHSDLCAFYGTLAISAFSLGGLFGSATWQEKGTSFKQQAREHARLMLRTAYVTPKVAKYKSILMALLIMVRVSIISGNRDQADCYLLESEKFIRLRGLPRKTKSRKMRLLHHCYAMERLLHETTFISGSNSKHRQHVRISVASSGLVAYGQDSMTFRLPDWRNFDQLMLEVKGQELGENDLHLEHPGIWPASLYGEIFGIPEEWVLLLSLVIRLGYEKDATENNSVTEPLALKDFLIRANSIEKRITQLYRLRQCDSSDNTIGPDTQPSRPRLAQMLDAMLDGLMIYFYRRIYNADSSILQPFVKRIRDYILTRDDDREEYKEVKIREERMEIPRR